MAQLSMEPRRWVLRALIISLGVGCVSAPPKLTEEQYNATFPPEGLDADALSDSESEDTEMDVSVEPDLAIEADTVVELDTSDVGQDLPVCVPTTEAEDPCDGLDNDCDGETDEDGGPPDAVTDFTIAQGWLREGPYGRLAHSAGPIPFNGFDALNTAAWTKMNSWTGDIRVEFKLFLAEVGPGAEWFMGSWTAETFELSSLTNRSGVLIRYKNPEEITVTSLHAGEELDSTVVSTGSFVGVEYRINAQSGAITVRLLQGNGLAVAEIVSVLEGASSQHDGLLVALTGGAIIGSIARVTVDSGGDCITAAVPECATESCGSVEPCTQGICNPLFGCDVQEKYCPQETDCLTASVCEPGTNTCTERTNKSDGTACNLANGCFENSTCLAGACADGPPTECASPNQCQDEGSCNTTLGFCTYPSKADGLVCDDSSLCTDGETCQKGTCTPDIVVECPEAAVCMTDSVCVPDTGECTESLMADDGTQCDDGNLCTLDDLCSAGACVGTEKVCDDENPCTTDVCVEGECEISVNPAVCEAWKQPVQSSAIGGSMVLLDNGDILGTGTSVFSLANDGTVQWTTDETLGTLTATGLVTSASNNYVAVTHTTLTGSQMTVLSTSDGLEVWKFSVPGDDCTGELDDPCRILALPTLNSSGVEAWVSTHKKGLHRVAADPTFPDNIVWSVNDFVGTKSSVTVAASGNLFVGQGGNTPGLRSITPNGTDRWLFATSSAVNSTPIVQQQTIYTTFGGTVRALIDGETEPSVAWSLTLGNDLTQTDAVLAKPDRLIVASEDTLWAIDVLGCVASTQSCVVWTRPSPLPGPISAGLLALDDGRLVYGADGGLQWLSVDDGTDDFLLPTTGLILGTPLVNGDQIIVGDSLGTVHAFDFTSLGLANSGWPVSRRSQRRNTVE